MCQLCDHEADLIKAISDGGSDPWRPHESPFIRELIERWTNHGLDKFGALQAELTKWLNHEHHKAGARVWDRPGAVYRWTPGELAAAKLYLESVPPEQFELDDWLLVIDYLVQRYLPHDVMLEEAAWLATRSAMMGRVQAHLGSISAAAAGRVLAALPFKAEVIERRFGMTQAQKGALEFGRARCAEAVTGVTAGIRARLRSAVIGWQEQVFLGAPSAIARSDLQTRLLDEFGTLNRDWRRIALTEAGENANQGFLASLPPGTRVKRLEMYHGACDFCRAIDGREFTVVAPDKRDKDGETEVWPGKNNFGRSSAPRKRTAQGLVARASHELWWAPAGVVHPHCRGRWIRVVKPQPGDDPAFAAWLKQHFAKKG